MKNGKIISLADRDRQRTAKQLDDQRQAVLNANYDLVPEQQRVLDMVRAGRNVKLTGEGGSGKTVTLRAVIKYVTSYYKPWEYAICASTGSAAVNLQLGKTIHSVFKLIPGTEELTPEEHFEEKFGNNTYLVNQMKRIKFVMIDEDSMLKAIDLEKIDYICRQTGVKWNRATRQEESIPHVPFGGKQILLCGDFSQLPPVFTNYNGPRNEPGRLLFESEAYDNGNFAEIMLKTNHRQQTDIRMQYILNCIRNGVVNEYVKQCVGQLRIPLEYRELNGLQQVACKLHCTKVDVEKYNLSQLRGLKGPEFVFQSEDHNASGYDYLLKQMRWPKELHLRVGAKVRLLVNQDFELNLVNGTPGVVLGFRNVPEDLPEDEVCRIRCAHDHIDEEKKFGVRVRFWVAEGVHHDTVITCSSSEHKSSTKVLASRRQIPLGLTFATTVHAAQGQTHPCFELDLSDAFEAGQGYVGMSRGTTLNGLYLSGFNAKRIRCDPRVVEYYKRFETEQSKRAEQELEEKALALGPFKVTLKDEFKHLEGTFRTDFDDMDDDADSERASKRQRRDEDDDQEVEKDPFMLLVTGSRDMVDGERMERALKKLIDNNYSDKAVTIITGDEPGTETLAAEFARNNGYGIRQFTMDKQRGADDDEKRKMKAKRMYRESDETVVFQLKSEKESGNYCDTVTAFVKEREQNAEQRKLYTYNF